MNPSEPETTEQPASTPTSIENNEDVTKDWQQFTLAEIETAQAQSGRDYYEFLDEAALQAGVYLLPADSSDNQSPHAQDEIYYILAGEAQIMVDGVDVAVQEGDVVFVKAGIDHRFHTILSNLRTLVIFTNTPSDAETPNWLKFELSEILAEKDAQRNVWNQFLSVPSMRFGMYSLPLAAGGDQALTHDLDELNIVVNGRSAFQMGDETIAIEPGTIIYVPAGIPHHFHTLSEDIDVLILWNGQ